MSDPPEIFFSIVAPRAKDLDLVMASAHLIRTPQRYLDPHAKQSTSPVVSLRGIDGHDPWLVMHWTAEMLSMRKQMLFP